MPQERVQRKLAAVLAADVVGYSRLMGADEVGTHIALKACRHVVIDPKVTEHRGRIVKSTGDGILADFASVVDAVVCAVEIQRTMAERNAGQPPHTRIDLRIGINLGDVIVDDGDIYGDGVNVAVRVEGIADRGGIAVSGKVYEEVCEKVDISFKFDGEYDVKNIAKPVLIYRALIDQPKARQIEPMHGESALRQSDGPIIAVLPFENLSRAHCWERFAAGISDEIVTNLARYPDLLVIARNSTLAYKGKPIDVRRIGRELNADYVLEGSIQTSGKRLRVTAQLIDARSGTHVWAERYDRTTVDLFLVQDDIVECVAGALGGFQGEILRSERRKLVRKAPASLRAYELYLLGYEAEARLDKEHTLRAIPLLERAIELDPQFARAWTVLGWACEHAAQANWATESSELASRRRAAVVAAAALDPRDPIAVGELGLLRAEDGDFDGAREAIERALSLGRNHADALALLAKHIPTVLGRTDDALSIMERAFKLNPHPPVWYFNSHARIAYFARDFVDAVHAAKRAADSLYPHLFKILALAQLGRSEGVAEAAADFWDRYPDFDPGSAIRDLPIVHPPAIELYCDGLRKAGFPHAEAQGCGIGAGQRACAPPRPAPS